jgi:hypothetical protein
MARSIDTILQEIITAKEAQSSLSVLTSDSKTAIWRLWAYVTAVAIHAHEVAWDLFKAQVIAIAAVAPAGTPGWYEKMMLAYQHGATLSYVGTQYVYDPVDETLRIVSRCAIEERTDGVLIVKLAKGEAGSLEPLTSAELAGATSYFAKIKFAGTRGAVVSIDADSLSLQYDLFYDPVIDVSVVQAAVQTAVEAHLNDLDFNGALNVTKLTDAIQRVDGVRDPVYRSGVATTASGVDTDVDVEHVPAAGYYELAQPVASMFNWIQKI